MLEGLREARDAGIASLRSYLERTFDVDWMLALYSVINSMASFDDSFHNHYYYQRIADQKWVLIPWDLDLTFGGMLDAESSLLVGVEEESDADDGRWNVVKDSFLTSYPNEYLARIKDLNHGILAPGRLKSMISEAYETAQRPEAESAPGGVDCDFDAAVRDMSDFVDTRGRWVEEWTEIPD